jgi:hypothetical protein
MSTAYEEAFGLRTLTGLIQTFKTTDRERFFSGMFEKGKRDTADGNTFEFDVQTMSRELAPVVGSSSPAPQTPVTDRARKRIGLVDVKEFAFIGADRLFRERVGGELLPNAKAVVAGELENLRGKQDKTKEYMGSNTLLGSLVISPATIPGSDYTDTVTYTVSTFTRSAAWATQGTSVIKDVELMVDQFEKDCGMEPGIVIHNVDLETSLLTNTEIKSLCSNQAYADKILLNSATESQVLRGLRLGGLEWRKSIGYYALNGVKTRFMPTTEATGKTILLPGEADWKSVFGLVEGTSFIPLSAFGAEGDLGVFQKSKPGYYAYSVLTHNPPGIELHAGWRGMHYQRFPTAVQVGSEP